MSKNLTDEQKNTFLKEEYIFLQGQYEDFDKRSLMMKGWVSSGTIAALALALSASYNSSLLIAFSVSLLLGVVWYLEAEWKLFQYALTDRIRVIEAYFRGDSDILIKDPAPFQVYHFWYRSYVKDEPIYEYEKKGSGFQKRPRTYLNRLFSSASKRFVYLPYLPLLLLSICAICFRLWST